jgi:uridine kinase
MRKLILIRGIPGAGKTTFAKFLFHYIENDIDVTMCAADDYFYGDDGRYNFDPSQLYNAHLSCQQNVEIAMQKAVTRLEQGWEIEPQAVIIVHNTSTAPKEVKTYVDLAVKYGFELTSLIVENRHGNKSVHNVPEEALDRMRGRFEVKL